MGNLFWGELSQAVFGTLVSPYTAQGRGHLPAHYAVSDFAEATVGLAGVALSRLGAGEVVVDRRRASLWFDMTLRPDGWEGPSIWDAIAGNYRCKDGWIRLHTNAPHHRDAALSVLKTPLERDAVARAVLEWRGAELEDAIVAANGCAAEMRGPEAWAAHPQGRAISGEPLVQWDVLGRCDAKPLSDLRGVKVLDLTRVLAGPVATRFLAGFGANVLRIDPPSWNEPSVEMEVTLGKHCGGLDLKCAGDLAKLKTLMAQADVFVHGYRANALERLGLGDDVRRAINPNMVDVRLNAYGWNGPWSRRRGFDSLVQMSCGIAAHGMMQESADVPRPLPVQALDHGTGYLMAACVLEGLARRSKDEVVSAKVSLARTAQCLMQHVCPLDSNGAITLCDGDFGQIPEHTSWGPAHRVKAPVQIAKRIPEWSMPAGHVRRHPAAWHT